MCLHGPRLEQVVHTHVYIEYLTGAVGREGLVRDIWIPTPKDLLPCQWVPVLFRTYSFPLLFEYQFTMYQNRDLQNLRRERLQVRDLTWSFLAYSQIKDTPGSFTVHLFHQKKLALLSLLKEVKLSPSRRIIKPITLYNLCPLTRHSR